MYQHKFTKKSRQIEKSRQKKYKARYYYIIEKNVYSIFIWVVPPSGQSDLHSALR